MAGCSGTPAALLLGVLVSLAAVGVHRSAFPLGLLLAVATSVRRAVVAAALAVATRTAASYVLGWLALFAVVVVGTARGRLRARLRRGRAALMAAGFVLVVVAVVALGGSRRHDPR